MTMEPPLGKWEVLERSLGAVVASAILRRVGSSDIETVHGGMPNT
jgi:hypothetical protein